MLFNKAIPYVILGVVAISGAGAGWIISSKMGDGEAYPPVVVVVEEDDDTADMPPVVDSISVGFLSEATTEKPPVDCDKAHSAALTDVEIIACNIYHEARGESLFGQLAVGLTTIARVESNRFPNTISGVVYQSGMFKGREVPQFSWTLDGLSDKIRDQVSWQRAMVIADMTYNILTYNLDVAINFGTSENPDFVDWREITHYHTVRSERASWTAGLRVLGNIGNHTFYGY